MARVKRAVNAHKKRRTTLELASGYRGQRSRLGEHVIGHAHLADVVQGRQAREEVDPFAREIAAEVRLGRELFREETGVLLRSP